MAAFVAENSKTVVRYPHTFDERTPVDAQENLTAIQTAKARAEEAATTTAGLEESATGALQTVMGVYTELIESLQLAATGSENAHTAAAAALEATAQHLSATPGDHSTVPSIMIAREACETAVNGLAFANETAKELPTGLAELLNDFTTGVAALLASKMEEISGMVGQSQGALVDAETHIAAVKG